jgi:hypothetical protein
LPKFVPAEKNTPFPRLVVLNMAPGVPGPKLAPDALPPGANRSRNENLKVPIDDLSGKAKLGRNTWLMFGEAPAPRLSPP